MRSGRDARLCRRLLPAIVLLSLLTPAAAQAAEAEVPLATRFESSGRGDLALTANTLMTCPDAGGTDAGCIAARAGIGGLAALNNNGYAMALVDVDSDPATFDSSSATLGLPAGATVQFAGLFYGARTSKGTGGAAAPDPAARGVVLLKPPGSISYSALAATVHDSAAIEAAYTGFVDVTSIVAAAGSGVYSVANVQAGTGEDRYGGWALVVAYANPAAEPHSIRVFEGLASIKAGEPPLQIGVSGLETPTAGSVSASVGIVAYEGDRGSSGDRFLVNGTALADPANPTTNVFNSSIAFRGADLGGRSPNYLNQLGFDADLLGADGILGNGATTATLEESTNVEQYLTQVVAVSIQLDPAALEPPPPPPSRPAASTAGAVAGKGSEAPEPKPKKNQPPPDQPPRFRLDVDAPSEVVRPTAVVSFEATVSSTVEEPIRKLDVCTGLPSGLDLIRAPGAVIAGDEACWRQPKLKAGTQRRYRATARVKASASGKLRTLTTVRAANAPTRRVRRTLLVRPLPAIGCARLSSAGEPTAAASC